MARLKRRDFGVMSLSFLDVVCCGFGAMILLLTLTKLGQRRGLEAIQVDLTGLVAKLQEELHRIRGETDVLEREMKGKVEQLSEEQALIARLRGDLSAIQGEFAATKDLSEVNEIIEGRLLAAQQELTEEMKRLQGRSYRRPREDATVGGVPVDSEYIVFIIDTSGSMQNYAWPLMLCSPSTRGSGFPILPPGGGSSSSGCATGRPSATAARSRESRRRFAPSPRRTRR
jgi:hypothetical protein